jgi:hypothetical protein
MSKDHSKIRYPRVHRFICVITLLSVVTTLIGGVINHVRFEVTLFSATLVFVLLSLLSRTVMHLWAGWEEVSHSEKTKSKPASGRA